MGIPLTAKRDNQSGNSSFTFLAGIPLRLAKNTTWSEIVNLGIKLRSSGR